MNSFAAGDQTDGVWFEYNRATNATYWLVCAANSSSRTKTPTSVIVAATTYSTFRIEINVGCTSANFYIDGVFVGNIANANLPNTAGRFVGIGLKIEKTAGSGTGNGRHLYCDFVQGNAVWITPRGI